MAKQFFEVFPALKLDAKVRDIFEQVTVEKVSATKQRDLIRVTIVSDYLIQKDMVFRVEKDIKKQLFAAHEVTVKLYEKFHLSEQYNPEKLMDAYKDSILLELRGYSPIEYNLFKGAKIEFPREGEMVLLVEDSVPARSKADELKRILEKIFTERCGLPVSCQMEYVEKKEGGRKEEDDIKIARQIQEITVRAFGSSLPRTKEVPENVETDGALADAARMDQVSAKEPDRYCFGRRTFQGK